MAQLGNTKYTILSSIRYSSTAVTMPSKEPLIRAYDGRLHIPHVYTDIESYGKLWYAAGSGPIFSKPD